MNTLNLSVISGAAELAVVAAVLVILVKTALQLRAHRKLLEKPPTVSGSFVLRQIEQEAALARTEPPPLELIKTVAKMRVKVTEPIPMILYCPNCFRQHIDKPEPCYHCGNPDRDGCGLMDAGYRCIKWDNPPHRSHLCAHCGHIWRPADVCTTGVERIETKGKNDNPLP